MIRKSSLSIGVVRALPEASPARGSAFLSVWSIKNGRCQNNIPWSKLPRSHTTMSKHTQPRWLRTIDWRTSIRHRVRVVQDAQLDTILPFLRDVPADSYPDARHITPFCGQNFAFLYALSTEPTRENQEAARKLVNQLIWRTTEQSVSRTRLRTLRADAERLLKDVALPMSSGALLVALSSIGVLLSKASTAGQYYVPDERPPRTPTECLVALLDMLDAAEESSRSSSSRRQEANTVAKIRHRGEHARLSSRMDMASVLSLLETAAAELDAASLKPLRDKTLNLAIELRSHGPAGPPLTRLLDNVYGRVWESILNAHLLTHMPPKVIEAANAIRAEFAKLFYRLPPDVQHATCIRLLERLEAELPRPWSGRDPRLQALVRHPTSPSLQQQSKRDRHHLFQERLATFLAEPSTTGPEAAGDYFVVLSAFDVMKHAAPDHSPWIHLARARYGADIEPRKGRRKFQSLAVAEPLSLSLLTGDGGGGGITLAHHAFACEGASSVRAGLVKIWDLDVPQNGGGGDGGESDDCLGRDKAGATGPISINMHSIRRGVPYVTGISGYMHLLCSFFAHLRGEMGLDVQHAVLGLLVYLVYDGGHTWNEGLQTVNYLEGKMLPLGVFGAPTLNEEALVYVADYNRFVELFVGTETEDYLRRAVRQADKFTIAYRRKYVGHEKYRAQGAADNCRVLG